jgi:hypothetical protein
MKIIFSAFIFLSSIMLLARDKFEDHFLNETMRIDFHHVGDANFELISIDRIYRQGIWAGSLNNLIDNFNNGRYYAKIYSLSSGNLIFSKGFDSYFGEYQTSSDAAKGIKKNYHESVLIPYPKDNVRFSIERRNKENLLEEIFNCEINPADIIIITEKVLDNSVEIYKDKNNGSPHSRVDIVILSEGYTLSEKKKFESDWQKFKNIFFDFEPYKFFKNKFNFYGVFKPSAESGVDEPRANIYKNTALNATFNSLGSERYLLTEDNKAVRDLAANVPYDAIVIMVNHSRYGGGGIYNLFATFTSDNQWNEYLLLHEFGHSFAGLADEYYTSDVAYDEFYKIDVEPVEPNITALLNPSELKWKNLVDSGTEIPTPWEKAEFDNNDFNWQQERRQLNNTIAELKRNKASESEIKSAQDEYDLKDKLRAIEVEKFLKKSKFWGKVGAFEGAGYLSKGLYRPMVDCLMFSKGNKPFCKVCENAVISVINHYSE